MGPFALQEMQQIVVDVGAESGNVLVAVSAHQQVLGPDPDRSTAFPLAGRQHTRTADAVTSVSQPGTSKSIVNLIITQLTLHAVNINH